MQPKIHYPAVYFVRHGQTAYNLENRWVGQVDQPLNQAGRNQVRSLAESLCLPGATKQALYYRAARNIEPGKCPVCADFPGHLM